MQSIEADPRRAWLRAGVIGGCVAVAIILVWPVGSTSVLSPAGAASRDRAQRAAEQQRDQVARQLDWIVTEARSLQLVDSTRSCLTAGTACSADGMLDVDTTRVRSTALAANLAAALDPKGAAYTGGATAAVTDLARRTSGSAGAVSTALGHWLAMGCGSNVDGVPVTTTHPTGCDDLARTATGAVDDLAKTLRGWPGG